MGLFGGASTRVVLDRRLRINRIPRWTGNVKSAERNARRNLLAKKGMWLLKKFSQSGRVLLLANGLDFNFARVVPTTNSESFTASELLDKTCENITTRTMGTAHETIMTYGMGIDKLTSRY